MEAAATAAAASAATHVLSMDHEAELRRVFALVDSSRDGSIDDAELKTLMVKLTGSDVTLEQVHRLKAKIDTDGDGEVSFAELKAAVSDWIGATVEEEAPGSPRKRALSGESHSPMRAKRFHAEIKQFFLSANEGNANAEELALGKIRSGAAVVDDDARAAQARVREDMSDMYASGLELWTFLGNDAANWQILPQLGLDIRGEVDGDVALAALDASVAFFRDRGTLAAHVQQINLAYGPVPQATDDTHPAFALLKAMVQHIGVILLFQTRAQRLEVKHKLCFIFSQAADVQFGDLMQIVISSAAQMLTGNRALSNEVHVLACIGGFFFLGGPRVPHLRQLHKFFPAKEYCKTVATRTLGALASACCGALVTALYDNARYPPGQKCDYILPSLLLLGVLLERSPQHPALFATLFIQKRMALGDTDATPHKVVKTIFELSVIGRFRPDCNLPIQRACSAVLSIMLGVSHRCPIAMPAGSAMTYRETLVAGGLVEMAGKYLLRVSSQKFTVMVPVNAAWGGTFFGVFDQDATTRHVFRIQARCMPGQIQVMMETELQSGLVPSEQAYEIIASTPLAPVKLILPHMPGALPDPLTLANVLTGLAHVFACQAVEEGDRPALDQETLNTVLDAATTFMEASVKRDQQDGMRGKRGEAQQCAVHVLVAAARCMDAMVAWHPCVACDCVECERCARARPRSLVLRLRAFRFSSLTRRASPPPPPRSLAATTRRPSFSSPSATSTARSCRTCSKTSGTGR